MTAPSEREAIARDKIILIIADAIGGKKASVCADLIIEQEIEPLRAGYGDAIERLSAALSEAERERDDANRWFYSAARDRNEIAARVSALDSVAAQALTATLSKAERERDEARQDVARLRILEEDFRNKVWENASAAESRASALEALLAECETVLEKLNGPDAYNVIRALLAKLKARKERRRSV